MINTQVFLVKNTLIFTLMEQIMTLLWHILLAAKVLSLAKMVIIIAIGSGINLFEYIGKQQPNWWIWCTFNKIYACLVVFFGSNMFEGMLISTGAFELYLNDIPVWSKLETGRIPQPAELLQIIDNYLLFDNPYPA
uniref:ACYPI003983 protein n=1 Tax=Acyrthosiphon pisum TaxID=7029 RepID=C4WUX0_ACYPI|nr:ACYPI003983 [Acyrthosiphon pisum]